MATTEHLRFSPQILRRLGEELVPHADLGIMELVRNAYDADAKVCTVELLGTDQIGGTIRVTDTGDGMTEDDIKSGWLLLGKSSKTVNQPTELGRLPVGEKGLGRLAALRLGRTATLTTRPKKEPQWEHRVVLDWSRFDTVESVDAVDLVLESLETREAQGTTVELTDVQIRLEGPEVHRLARELLLLADPFGEDPEGFRPTLVAPGFAELEELVHKGYREHADFHLIATIGRNGRASAMVLDWKGETLWSAEHADFSASGRLYATVPTTFDLWAFVLNPQGLSGRHVKLEQLKEWLTELGGVRIYHRGLRVHPYGDPGHDWLDMNLLRVRSPELRPSTNNSIGRFVVVDPTEQLKQKTDRTGFIENEAFQELRRFGHDALQWMARIRLSERESRRRATRTQAPRDVEQAHIQVDDALLKLPARARRPVAAAIQQLEKARKREATGLRNELQLYRTLATVGTTVAVFAHDAAKPATQIAKLGGTLKRRAIGLLGAAYETTLARPIELILRSVEALRSFANLPIRLLQSDKRRPGRVDVHAVIREVVALFGPFLKEADVTLQFQLADGAPGIRGSVAALESIITNLITNCINAFTAEDAQTTARRIIIRTTIHNGTIAIQILDSGSGIRKLKVSDIWLPGETTVPGGTGLGLTIVRDTVADLGGRVHAVAQGELGGAELRVELNTIAPPRKGE